jgi:hypothetical protein
MSELTAPMKYAQELRISAACDVIRYAFERRDIPWKYLVITLDLVSESLRAKVEARCD